MLYAPMGDENGSDASDASAAPSPLVFRAGGSGGDPSDASARPREPPPLLHFAKRGRFVMPDCVPLTRVTSTLPSVCGQPALPASVPRQAEGARRRVGQNPRAHRVGGA